MNIVRNNSITLSIKIKNTLNYKLYFGSDFQSLAIKLATVLYRKYFLKICSHIMLYEKLKFKVQIKSLQNYIFGLRITNFDRKDTQCMNLNLDFYDGQF